MKKIFAAISIFVLIPAAILQADEELPKRLNFSRYQGMLDHSPFAVASAALAPIATPDAFKGLYIANAAHTPEADLVTMMSSDDKNLKEYLSTKEPNEHGYAISSIEWSDRPGGTKVTISKDGKFGTLNFNQALVAQPLPNIPPPPAQAQPGQPVNPGIPKAPLRIPSVPGSTPRVRGVIPRNPGATATRPPGVRE